MKHRFIISILFFSCLLFCSLATSGQVKNKVNYTAFVDPYIGSGGHGHVFIGANVPFGALQLGPQNIYKGWDWCSGYHYSDSIIIGFSHTHLSGSGCCDLGDVLLMPYIGKVRTARGEQNDIQGCASSYFSHSNEKVSPGYYSVLMDNGVGVELTATERVGMHHYTYPATGERRLLINLEEGIGNTSYDTYLKKIDDYTIEGYRFVNGWCPNRKVFFYMKYNQPIQSLQLFDSDKSVGYNVFRSKAVKGVVTFKNSIKDVLVKVSISSVSCSNAAMNMNTEMPGWNFGSVHQQAVSKWNKQLSCIDIASADIVSKRIFYTALYHAFIVPNLYCDVNGDFRGHDGKIYTKNKWENYSTFSLWDTYRSLNPLFTIIQKKRVSHFVNSFLSIYDQQGKLPIWALVGGDTECMPGYSSVPVIADAYLKGISGFDATRALNDMISTATNQKQIGIPYLMQKGYIPCDKVYESVSTALEYAADDWGIALMAKKMGRIADYQNFLKRGHYYTRYFDKSIGFVRPVMNDGSWRTPYNPFTSIHENGDFTEGTGWQYTFFVPQHPEGLIELMGGESKFLAKLDSLFIVHGDMGKLASPDITGLVGQYAHGNEPCHHMAYLYDYAGEQWKTADRIRMIQRTFYTDSIDGICGNEDCGQMSAWHILSAMGFYQVNPSNGVFAFGSPLFKKAVINLPGGKHFTIVAKNNSDKNVYIQSVTLNGKSYKNAYILYNDIMKGGNLTFIMGNQPNKSFGAAPANRPKTAQ
jgi:predicted alpha-1,2-mannosidase